MTSSYRSRWRWPCGRRAMTFDPAPWPAARRCSGRLCGRCWCWWSSLRRWCSRRALFCLWRRDERCLRTRSWRPVSAASWRTARTIWPDEAPPPERRGPVWRSRGWRDTSPAEQTLGPGRRARRRDSSQTHRLHTREHCVNTDHLQ